MPPHAPMPPLPDFNQGPFEGIPEGPQIINVGGDDFSRSPFPDDDDDYDRHDQFEDYEDVSRKPKKNKKNNNKEVKMPVEIKYEGYILEKAQPRQGEKPSWERVGKRTLPFEDKELLDSAKRRRQRSRTTVQQDFKLLSSNQQGIVNRLILERKQQEKNKSAEWILYDVQRSVQWKWRSMEVKKLTVILKRVDKNHLKNKENSMRGAKESYHAADIIDLAVDPNKKNVNKKPKKSKSFDDFGPLEDPLGHGMGIPPPPNHGHNHDIFPGPRGSRDQFQPMPQMPPPPPNHPPPNHVPLGAFPVDQNMPEQFHQPFPPNPRQPFPNMNPFQPNPEVASPLQFDGPEWPLPHPHGGGMDRPQTRSPGRNMNRRPSARRASTDADKIRALEEKIDNLSFDVRNGQQMGSDSSDFDEGSIFSLPPSDSRSFTPPSSPRSHFSEGKPRGSLDRRRSSASRDPRYHARYRSHQYQDTEIEPGYSHHSERRFNAPEYRRSSGKRPSLHHAATYDARDDYPVGRGAELRALPPPRPLQRSLTEHPDTYDFRDYDELRRPSDMRERPRRISRNFDPVQEAYEAGRRDSVLVDPVYDGRRRSSYVGGRDYYN